jgi:hypothetical protein
MEYKPWNQFQGQGKTMTHEFLSTWPHTFREKKMGFRLGAIHP